MSVSTFDADPFCLSKYGSDIGLKALFEKPGGLTEPDEEGNTFDINTKDERESTCLIWAARGGHASTTKMLLEKGADVEVGHFLPHLADATFMLALCPRCHPNRP